MFCERIDEKTKQIFGLTKRKYDGYVEVVKVEQGWDGKYYLPGHAPEKTQNIINSERITELQNYLNKTDWFAVRFAETGVSVPDDIKAARQSAREEISRLRGDNDQNDSQMDPLY